jgi:hypothetical protein
MSSEIKIDVRIPQIEGSKATDEDLAQIAHTPSKSQDEILGEYLRSFDFSKPPEETFFQAYLQRDPALKEDKEKYEQTMKIFGLTGLLAYALKIQGKFGFEIKKLPGPPWVDINGFNALDFIRIHRFLRSFGFDYQFFYDHSRDALVIYFYELFPSWENLEIKF